MRVLVTGATGFLGSWVTRALVAAGHEVRVFVRRPERLRELLRLRLDVACGDVLERASIDAAAHGVAAIVHCAGHVSWRPRDREEIERVNLDGTRNVLDVARARRVRLLHTSTVATIGPTRRPEILDETSGAMPLGFDDPYTRSKRESERLVLEQAAAGAEAVVLNPGVVLGPGDAYLTSTQLVLRYVRGESHHYLPGGSSYCDVRDVAAAYPRALRDGRPGERYILAGVNRTNADFREDLRRLTGLHLSFPVAPPLAEWFATWSEVAARYAPHPFEEASVAVVRWGSLFTYCSAAKAQQALGYRVRPFSETLRDTIADHLRRRAAHPVTPALRRILESAPYADL